MSPFSLIPIAIILIQFHEARPQIISSSDLNCDFSTDCRWRNSTDEGGKWAVSNKIQIDQGHSVMPMGNADSLFAYTQGFMGRTTAILVSDVVSCQLGGANLKYWYYKTGAISQLEICVKQPPGSRENANLRCYDGMSSTLAQQWIFRVIELPPSSQPFEIVFRATFFPPSDVIALDDIIFSAALCVPQEDSRKTVRSAPPIIGYRDWQLLRESEHFRGQTMIIVSQKAEDDRQKTEPPPTTTAVSTTEATTTPNSTIDAVTEAVTTTQTAPSTFWPTKLANKDPESLSIGQNLLKSDDQVVNFVRLLKETAPLLPLIPSLVRSLTMTEANAPLPPKITTDVRFSPTVRSQHFYNSGSSQESVASDSQGKELTTMTPVTATNAFGLLTTTMKSIRIVPTVYPASLIRNHKTEQLRNFIGRQSKTATTTAEPVPEDPIEVHEQLFPQQTPAVVVFNKPTKGESELATKLTELADLLPGEAANDLQALQNIPDLEGLVKGMDLSLIRKPGGFARLRQQFIQRLMRRSMGLPLETSNDSQLPPPIVPVRVTKKAMMQRAFRTAKVKRAKSAINTFNCGCLTCTHSEIANEGTNQGAGGGFADETSPAIHTEHRKDETVQIAQLSVDTPQKPLSFAAPTAVEATRAAARVGPQFTPMCPLVDCTFDDGTLCNYLTSNSSSAQVNLREWRASSRGILNTLTGIPHDLNKEGFFLFAGGERVQPSETFVLSTKTPFSLKDAVTLDFFVYQAGFKGRLSVCSNKIHDCSLVLDGSNITNTARQWKNYQIPLNPSTHAVHFVADRLQNNYAIGLDHIQLLNKYGSSSLSC